MSLCEWCFIAETCGMIAVDGQLVILLHAYLGVYEQLNFFKLKRSQVSAVETDPMLILFPNKASTSLSGYQTFIYV
jgi:hypothetical protein